MKHRWPKSLHSQTEAIFHGIRSFREPKTASPLGLRAFGSWESYKNKAHRFVGFMHGKGRSSLLDTRSVRDDMADYLEQTLTHYVEKKRSRQTMETLLSALGKFEYALNRYIEQHGLDVPPLETEALRLEYYAQSRKLLRKSSRVFDNRAFPDPIRLIETIHYGTFQLQAALQYEGGLRAEGVGAPSNRKVKNPLTSKGLRGTGSDPVTGAPVGIVASVEKGGKETKHYVSIETYRRLESYIKDNGKLESDYSDYVAAINRAARETGQHASGRGSHGLKHNFAQERYLECINHGLSHEQALQQTSLETSHFRLRETLTYTRG
jgi:integrase